MNKFLLALLLVAPLALANPGGEGNNTNCNGQGNPNSPCEGNGGNNGEPQGNSNTSSVEVSSESEATAVSGSHSSSNSNSSGGSVRSNINVSGGESNASARATSGDSNATGGSAGAVAAGGDARAVGGKSESSSGGNTLSTSYVNESTAASAAPVFAGYCQTGGAVQGDIGGFNIVNPEQFCNHIRAAAVFREAMLFELEHGKVQCAEPASSTWVDDQYSDTCVNEKAAVYYDMYHENLQEADELLNATQEVGKVDAFFGYLARPLAIIGLLIFLI